MIRPSDARLLSWIPLPSPTDPAALLPPSLITSFGEVGSVYGWNDTAYDLYLSFGQGIPSRSSYDLRVPGRSWFAWPVRTIAIAIAIDHTVHDPAALGIQLWGAEATLAPYRGAL